MVGCAWHALQPLFSSRFSTGDPLLGNRDAVAVESVTMELTIIMLVVLLRSDVKEERVM